MSLREKRSAYHADLRGFYHAYVVALRCAALRHVSSRLVFWRSVLVCSVFLCSAAFGCTRFSLNYLCVAVLCCCSGFHGIVSNYVMSKWDLLLDLLLRWQGGELDPTISAAGSLGQGVGCKAASGRSYRRQAGGRARRRVQGARGTTSIHIVQWHCNYFHILKSRN